MIIILMLSMLCFLSYMFCVYYGIKEKNNSKIIIGYILLGSSIILATLIGVVNIFRQPVKKNQFKEEVRKYLAEYFKKLNKTFENRGLHWGFTENHYWIELWINKDQADEYRVNTKYDPQKDSSLDI